MHVREMLRRAAVASGRLGVKWMVVRPLNDTVRCEYDTEVELATNREFYAPVLEECKKAGVGIAFENMYNFSPDDYRRSYCENPEDLIALVDSYGDGSVGVCWDFGHANFVLADQPRALRKLGSRIKTTHVQDNRGAVDSHLIPFGRRKRQVGKDHALPCRDRICGRYRARCAELYKGFSRCAQTVGCRVRARSRQISAFAVIR